MASNKELTSGMWELANGITGRIKDYELAIKGVQDTVNMLKTRMGESKSIEITIGDLEDIERCLREVP